MITRARSELAGPASPSASRRASIPMRALLSLIVLAEAGLFSACSAGEVARRVREVHIALAPLVKSSVAQAEDALAEARRRADPAASRDAVRVPSVVASASESFPPLPALEPVPRAELEPTSPRTQPSRLMDPDADAPPPANSNPATEPEPPDPEHLLIALALETRIYARPTFKSTVIGYLRTGAQVRRAARPVSHEGCRLGFYRVMPEGYVCVGPAATLDPNHPLAQFARVRPDRTAALPYRYARSLQPTPALYTRLPSASEQARVEGVRSRANAGFAWRGVIPDPTPELLLAGNPTPIPFGVARDTAQLTSGRALPDSSFALLAVYESAGRRFGLATDLTLLPLDRLKPVEPSAFHGLALGAGITLPVAFVRTRHAFLYTGNPRTSGLSLARALGFREAVPLSGRTCRVDHASYLETQTGDWIRDEHLVRVDTVQKKPGWVSPGRSWIQVSISKQTLVAYEGETPVYVTLVSTGADGMGDPATTHSTVRGEFLIHTKHVTATMDSDDVDDAFDLRDVPYVQYFTEGYAFHSAYWHDDFGTPHSHGCVNLSPLDSRWLFHWTDPPVPQNWHGALSRSGTVVYIGP